ncbi:ABC-type amino acid transport system permease subunit [Pseudomonas sp. JAI120]|nr:ABC-type amino acid transport system permease subunit [Pseudomonas sp. SJZ073]MBB6314999.1 ABC-type amino acid transport system permease subunit [Pseudomonas sp. JAI120]
MLRAGVEAVPLAQIELGKSIGLSDWQLLRHVILPQAGILSLPALFANFIFLLKETTVVSAVLTLICVLLFLPLSLLLSRLERRLQHGQFGS